MATYPTPKQGLAGSAGQSGPPYLKYIKHRKDWKELTLISVFEDKGVDTNESAADMPQRWTLEYDGLSEAQVAILDSFWDQHRLSVDFTFVEPRDAPWTEIEGDTVTGVNFEDYEDGDHTKVWINRRVAHLIKYPS